MGLIEQAAKRLEELKRTGVDLQDGLREAGANGDADPPWMPRVLRYSGACPMLRSVTPRWIAPFSGAVPKSTLPGA